MSHYDKDYLPDLATDDELAQEELKRARNSFRWAGISLLLCFVLFVVAFVAYRFAR